MKHLKILLSQNIERAVSFSGPGRGVWVWDVRRDFVQHIIFDNTRFHGFSYSEEYEDYDDRNNTWIVSSQVLVLSSELERSLKLQDYLDQLD